MKAEKINQPEINFYAKVSPRFVNSMRGYINNGSNRLQNNYKLTKKIEEYARFGYDDYTIEMRQKSGPLGFEYKLYAVKDDEDASKEVVLTKKHYTAYSKIFNRFMNLNEHDFKNIMRKYTK